MAFLLNWLNRASPEKLYRSTLEFAESGIKTVEDHLWGRMSLRIPGKLLEKLFKQINKPSIKNSHSCVKARFLLSIFKAAFAIDQAACALYLTLQANVTWPLNKQWSRESPTSATIVRWDKSTLFNNFLYLSLPGLHEKIVNELKEAAVAFEQNPDVDIKVAEDLGAGSQYPERPAFPTGNDLEFVKIAAQRIKLFWETVLKTPVHPVVEIMTGASTQIIAPNSEQSVILRQLLNASSKEDQAEIEKLLPLAFETGLLVLQYKKQATGRVSEGIGYCDLCNATLQHPHDAEQYSALQVQKAVRAGLRPPDSMRRIIRGFSQDMEDLIWMKEVIKDTTDWLLCPSCVLLIEKYL